MLRHPRLVGAVVLLLFCTTGLASPLAAPHDTALTMPHTWRNSIGMEFVLIPVGEFLMGSNERDDDEKPRHRVRISQPFYLGTYEVTQGQWQAVMGDNPSYFKGEPSLPVESVSWEDVQEFIRRLQAKERGTRYRLPTEAEWEYAARAGTTTAYSFGDDTRQVGDYAWYKLNAGGTTHPVGQKHPNAWGLYDMAGNVSEWIQDWYGDYTAAATTDPQGPSSGSHRVIRGGNWSFEAGYCRSADRGISVPNARLMYLGFRLLRTAQ
jgi:formylglycine-generating enzyme required for sulfatase activity